VVEVIEEEVGEELLSGAELATRSTEWGDKRRRLPPMRCLWKKMTVGKSRGPASLADVVGRLLVQEGRRDEALLLAWSDSSGRLIGDEQRRRSSGQCRAEQHGARPNGGGEKVEWATASSVTSGAVVRGPSHVGRQRPVATGTERSPHGEHDHREQGRHAGPGDRPGRSNGNGPLTCGPNPLNDFQISKQHSKL
jgi:hypothetical protein